VRVDGPWCQRWRERRQSWRHRSEGGFDAAGYRVEALEEGPAKRFVVTHHYSGTYPAAARRYGLWNRTGALVGVAVFGVPASNRVLTNVFPDLEPVVESLECSRFVLLDGPGNEESWFLARCFDQLAARGVRGVVSFADPVPRRTASGAVVCPGHVGTIYQATNAIYTGRGTARTVIVLPDGTTLHARAIQKVRRQERGHLYVEQRLCALGAPPPRAFEPPAAWLTDALATIGADRLRHRGCHRYCHVLGATRRARAQVRVRLAPATFPKQVDHLPAQLRETDW